MLVIFSYDIKNVKERSKTLNKIHKICKKYLFKIQYSVFVGELSKPLYKELMEKIKKVINEELDSIMVIKIINKNNADLDFIGKDDYFNNIII